ncbi:snRNA-activating protein complex subunit 5 isoform X1 [Grammomys surdaster]|uniref:snRNA-activating protein complex subunit 5 isoform X1 n=1 Tax=Grammomys surdaster TaxID=491861 RepID=UPI00109F996E|nr:snRNA-activating protein complex subunit 5 isoform X1 [Grammomys surdaster]
MLSRLQELRKEEETLLRLKAALHDQLNRLKVEELALQSMISSRGRTETLSSQPAPEQLCDASSTLLVYINMPSLPRLQITPSFPVTQMSPKKLAVVVVVEMSLHVDNEASINQTTLKLSTRSPMEEEEEEEEEEESDS